MKPFRAILLLALCVPLIACDGEIISPAGGGGGRGGGAPDANTNTGGGEGAPDANMNTARADAGVPPPIESGLDANGGGAHGNFGMCGERAQNTCPKYRYGARRMFTANVGRRAQRTLLRTRTLHQHV